MGQYPIRNKSLFTSIMPGEAIDLVMYSSKVSRNVKLVFFFCLTEFLGMLVSSYVLIKIFVGISERYDMSIPFHIQSSTVAVYTSNTMLTMYRAVGLSLCGIHGHHEICPVDNNLNRTFTKGLSCGDVCLGGLSEACIYCMTLKLPNVFTNNHYPVDKPCLLTLCGA